MIFLRNKLFLIILTALVLLIILFKFVFSKNDMSSNILMHMSKQIEILDGGRIEADDNILDEFGNKVPKYIVTNIKKMGKLEDMIIIPITKYNFIQWDNANMLHFVVSKEARLMIGPLTYDYHRIDEVGMAVFPGVADLDINDQEYVPIRYAMTSDLDLHYDKNPKFGKRNQFSFVVHLNTIKNGYFVLKKTNCKNRCSFYVSNFTDYSGFTSAVLDKILKSYYNDVKNNLKKNYKSGNWKKMHKKDYFTNKIFNEDLYKQIIVKYNEGLTDMHESVNPLIGTGYSDLMVLDAPIEISVAIDQMSDLKESFRIN